MTSPSIGPRRSWRVVSLAAFALVVLAAGSFGGVLEEMKSRGFLRWGADAEGGAPYVFPDPKNPKLLIGFEVEIADALGEVLGVREEMVQNSWDGLVSALDRGSFDVILNGLEITPEHLGQIAMSRPYYAYTQQIVVLNDEEGVRNVESLKGKRVGVLSASVAHRLLEKMGGVDIRIYPGNVETCKDLKNKRIDATVMDLPIATHYAKPDPALKFAGKPFAVGYYGVGVRKGDKELLREVDKAIGRLIANGELKRIYKKWGLWDGEQERRLREYKPVADPGSQKVSTLREWRQYLPLLLKGAVVTVEISFMSMAVAVGLGLLLALGRLFGVAPVRWASTAYVEVFRGTPLLIQLYLIYYGLPNLGIRLSSLAAAVLGLGLNYAAYEAENYRAGIQAIPRGQMEAALSLGMTRWQALRRIVLPQAVRVVIPPISNDFIALFKDSSLVSVITMVELTKVYGMLATTTYDYMGLGLMTAAIYFALSYPASLAANYVERSLTYDHR
ncbi:MAG: ABC transporter permease subunit [Elusimicrobia bacterium]|nr:ABC transporter permease subunit [Elusimicrobiota bacterium]